MQRLFPLIFVFACGPQKTPALALSQAATGPDAQELLIAAEQINGGELRWARACLQAGVRQACEDFARGQPRLRAFLALAFGEPGPAQHLLQGTEEAPAVRRDLALGIARLYRRGDTQEALLRARAALKTVESLDAAGARAVDRQLIEISLAVTTREFATSTQLMRTLMQSDVALNPEQRDELIRLGTLNAERAADAQRDVTDQARKLFAEMNKLSPDEAIAEAEQLAQKHPASSLVWMAVGFARLKSSDEPGAVLAWEKARSLCAFDPEPDFQLAKLHERRARYSRAVYFLARGMDIAPVWPKGLWFMTEMAMKAREPDSSAKALAQLKRLFPEDVLVDLGRARALLDHDEGLRALAVLKEAVRSHPHDVRPSVALGRAAIALHARANSSLERDRLLGEAENALKSAENVQKEGGGVESLRDAIEKLK